MSFDLRHIIKTRRSLMVSIAFALGIILSSAFLSYMGFRSFQMEDRLIQKDVEARYIQRNDSAANRPALVPTPEVEDAPTRDQLIRRRQWIFGGLIGISFIAILAGLVIMGLIQAGLGILGQAVERETEAANLKAEFVANVSHDLRTPLTIISQIEEKLSHEHNFSADEKKEIYAVLRQQTGLLRGLVEDFLDFSKILAGKKTYQSEPQDLVALVQESIDLFDPKAEARGFQITTHLPLEPIPIMGDARAILQAILNLLDNALKYSGEAREIEVRVERTPTHGIAAIKDRGIGLSEINREKIFEKFYRIEDKRSARLESGVGLGLAMVKHVIEGHKGHIGVESQIGKGSTFSLSFPLMAEGK